MPLEAPHNQYVGFDFKGVEWGFMAGLDCLTDGKLFRRLETKSLFVELQNWEDTDVKLS